MSYLDKYGEINAENYQKNNDRIGELIRIKYSKCKPNGEGGLTPEEEQEFLEREFWQGQALCSLSNYYQTYCTLEPGTLVEATFEDGTIIAKIHENKQGHYTITTPDGNGSGCSIAAHKVRKLTALELFNLGVNGTPKA